MTTIFTLLVIIAVVSLLGGATNGQNGIRSVISPKLVKKELDDKRRADEKNIKMGNVEPSPVVKTVFFQEVNGHRMAEVSWTNKVGEIDVLDCGLYGDKLLINEVLKDVPVDEIRFVGKDKMNNIISKCTALLLSQDYRDKQQIYKEMAFANGARKHGLFGKLVIYPGTKWCGAGNIAAGYDDLGAESEADLCCRAHDHCNDSLPSGAYKYGLKNVALFSKSHCDCDYLFAECLSYARTTVANSIGRIYFNSLQVQCFKNDHPIVKCLRYKGVPFIYWSCQKYQLDRQKPFKWQFFDAKYFDVPE